MTFEIEVNGKEIKARKGETILSALNRNGIKVPTLCHMPDLSPTGNCRLCVVEIEGQKSLAPSCAHPVEKGMRIKTHSSRVIKARKAVVELLMSNHPADCLYCERNGNCELQSLSSHLNIRERHSATKKINVRIDASSAAFIRDLGKCILCGRCVRICTEIMDVCAIDFTSRGNKTSISPSFRNAINASSCINCGQCIMACPTGALIEKSNIEIIQQALVEQNKNVVVILSPTIGVSVAETLGLKPGKDYSDIIVAALKKIGVNKVINLGAIIDFHSYIQAVEIQKRIKENNPEPLISSCCPSWRIFVNEFYPELNHLLFETDSPQQIAGSIIKNVFTEHFNTSKENIFTVSITSCISKKHEAHEDSLKLEETNIDAVITTRELIKLIRLYGIDMNNIEGEKFDEPFRVHSSASSIYGFSGGQTESVLRTLNYLIEGKEKAGFKIGESKVFKNRREGSIKMGDHEIGVAIVSGTNHARDLLEEIKNGKMGINYIEVMACHGGCVNGGGQPLKLDDKLPRSRAKTLCEGDENSMLRYPFRNTIVDYLNTHSEKGLFIRKTTEQTQTPTEWNQENSH